MTPDHRPIRSVCTALVAVVCLTTPEPATASRAVAAGAPSAIRRPTAPQSALDLAGCPMLPAENIWNAPVDHLPVDRQSAAYVATIGADARAKADFGSGLWNGGPIGIPLVLVPGTQPRVPLTFRWPGESDAGPYPIPPDAPIEGGAQADPNSDRHILVVDGDNCILYEVYQAIPRPDGGWNAGSGAIFDLRSNKLRPDIWTSADAAGLPMLPGLVRFDEVAAGEIRHAVRFVVPETRRAYVWPGRHFASSLVDAKYPPMGQRFRLKAGFDIGDFSPEVQVILRGLKKYGMMLADNGSAWFIGGAPDEGWNNDHLAEIRRVHGSDFEAVDVSSLMIDPNSGQVRRAAVEPSATPTPDWPNATATTVLATATRTPTAVEPTAVRPTATKAVGGAMRARAWVPWVGRGNVPGVSFRAGLGIADHRPTRTDAVIFHRSRGSLLPSVTVTR